MKTSFKDDMRGVSAVEFALILPLFIALIGFALNLGTILANRNAAQSVAFAAAAAGAAVIHQGGTANAAITKAQQVITTNTAAGVLVFGATASTPVIIATVVTSQGGAISVAFSVNCPMPFPVGFPSAYSFQIKANG